MSKNNEKARVKILWPCSFIWTTYIETFVKTLFFFPIKDLILCERRVGISVYTCGGIND